MYVRLDAISPFPEENPTLVLPRHLQAQAPLKAFLDSIKEMPKGYIDTYLVGRIEFILIKNLLLKIEALPTILSFKLTIEDILTHRPLKKSSSGTSSKVVKKPVYASKDPGV